MAIDALGSDTRRRLAEMRQAAKARGTSKVLPQALRDADEAASPEVRCHFRLLASELAFLDGKPGLAIDAIDRAMRDFPNLPDALKYVVLSNKELVRALSLQNYDFADHLRTLDARRSLRPPQDTTWMVLDALRAARLEKHFDALPALRAYFTDAYWSGDWAQLREAANELTYEYVRLSRLPDAVSTAIEALNDNAVQVLAEAVLKSRDAELISQTVTRILQSRGLLQHARLACLFIRSASDAIPDALVDDCGFFALSWAKSGYEVFTPLNVSHEAWMALRAVGRRLSRPVADDIVQHALDSPFGLAANHPLQRKEVVRACRALLTPASDNLVASLTQRVIDLANDKSSDYDYADLLSLLWEASDRSDIARQMVVSDFLEHREVSNAPGLLQLAAHLDVRPDRELDALALRLAQRVRMQVSVGTSDGHGHQSGGFGVVTTKAGDRSISIQVSNFGPAFEGLLAHPERLSEEPIGELAAAMLSMIQSPENLLTNKSELVHYLGRFASRLDKTSTLRSVEQLLSIAIASPADPLTSHLGAQDDPMNPFRLSFGSPLELRGYALTSLAQFERNHPGEFTDAIQDAIAEALADSEPALRASAYLAASHLSSLSEALVTGLLVATRDPDPRAASAALRAFANTTSIALTTSDIRYLIQAIVWASLSEFGTVRSAAAAAAHRINHLPAAAPHMAPLRKVQARLRHDVLFSVRRSAAYTYPDA